MPRKPFTVPRPYHPLRGGRELYPLLPSPAEGGRGEGRALAGLPLLYDNTYSLDLAFRIITLRFFLLCIEALLFLFIGKSKKLESVLISWVFHICTFLC